MSCLLYSLSYPVPSAADILLIFSDKPLVISKGNPPPCTKSPAEGNDRSGVAVSQTGPKTKFDCPGLKGQQESTYTVHSNRTLNVRARSSCAAFVTKDQATRHHTPGDEIREFRSRICVGYKDFPILMPIWRGVIGSLDILVCPGHVRACLSGCNGWNELNAACYICELVSIFCVFLIGVNVKYAFLYLLFLHN